MFKKVIGSLFNTGKKTPPKQPESRQATMTTAELNKQLEQLGFGKLGEKPKPKTATSIDDDVKMQAMIKKKNEESSFSSDMQKINRQYKLDTIKDNRNKIITASAEKIKQKLSKPKVVEDVPTSVTTTKTNKEKLAEIAANRDDIIMKSIKKMEAKKIGAKK